MTNNFSGLVSQVQHHIYPENVVNLITAGYSNDLPRRQKSTHPRRTKCQNKLIQNRKIAQNPAAQLPRLLLQQPTSLHTLAMVLA